MAQYKPYLLHIMDAILALVLIVGYLSGLTQFLALITSAYLLPRTLILAAYKHGCKANASEQSIPTNETPLDLDESEVETIELDNPPINLSRSNLIDSYDGKLRSEYEYGHFVEGFDAGVIACTNAMDKTAEHLGGIRQLLVAYDNENTLYLGVSANGKVHPMFRVINGNIDPMFFEIHGRYQFANRQLQPPHDPRDYEDYRLNSNENYR